MRIRRTLKVPIPLVVIIILISIYLIIAPMITNPSLGLLVAASIILFGLVFYYPFVYRRIEWSIVSKSTSTFRLTCRFHSPDLGKINRFLIELCRLQRAQVRI